MVLLLSRRPRPARAAHHGRGGTNSQRIHCCLSRRRFTERASPVFRRAVAGFRCRARVLCRAAAFSRAGREDGSRPRRVARPGSVELNDNRRLHRSGLLLDQDRAVRSASLASIYRDAGMPDVSLREAASAVTYDYANYSAHLFLANSFDALRDPTRFNLRYETAWFNELLLANLLAPVGAGTFSQSISQQEYSRLFDAKRLGLTTTTDVRSDGQYREV